MRRRRSTKPRDDLMDRITAAAAAGDDEAVAALTVQANLEDVDRRRHATPLPTVDGDDLAIDTVIADLRARVDRAHARRDVHGERDALERLAAFQERTGRA